MSQCHDLYDTVWPASKRRTGPTMVTQCHDPSPAPVTKDDEQPPGASEPVRPLEFA
jgi:hypothetical protein